VKSIRHLGIQKNQKIALLIELEGTFRLRVPRYPNVGAVRGAVAALSPKRTWSETLAIAREDRVPRKLKRTRG
jgi:hypothetical protein